MSTYYEYQDVKVAIAHKLMNMPGWTVYGYRTDESDPMTDYWSPAYWGGVAEKNGYVLCVDVYGAAKPEEIKQYNHSTFVYDKTIAEKIKKLEQVTVQRGASEAEEISAKKSILRLQKKAAESAENRNKYSVVGMIPGHMAHPPKMNWHIEKDGIIIEKGNGILKFAKIADYYKYDSYKEDYKLWQSGKDNYISKTAEYLFNHGHYCSMEDAVKSAISRAETMEEHAKLIVKFEDLLNRFDTTCGSLLGEGAVYEKNKVTEYKTELKAVPTTTGEIKDGQLFMLKVDFNYGCRRGLVYRIHEREHNGHKYFYACKLNGKLTKECTGLSSPNNSWNCFGTRFLDWVAKGSITWCELEEVKTPYEVEKVKRRDTKKAC